MLRNILGENSSQESDITSQIRTGFKNLLFICSAGLQRSPTAAELFQKQGYNTAFAGMYAADEKAVTIEKLRWADKVFVMESRHREDLQRRFPEFSDTGCVYILGIPDIYVRNDPELKTLLKKKVEPHL